MRVAYSQGQYVGKIREYFYYVCHNGDLFLDDSRMKNFTAAYKDVQFLNFFYSRIQENRTSRYSDSFPYISLCGIERNYLRCNDTPIVYTELDEKEEKLRVGKSQIFHHFLPKYLSMTENGRVYHRCDIGGRALISDKLTDKLNNRFEFNENGYPVAFRYRNMRVLLEN